MQGYQASVGNISFKLIIFVVLLILDLAITSFIEMSFVLTSYQQSQAIAILAINLITCGGLLLILYIMMWQTFLLRYGLIRILFSEFKWTLLITLVVFLLTVGERTYRLIVLMDTSSGSVYDNAGVSVLYYLRMLAYPVFYCAVVHACLDLSLPQYYMGRKWLKHSL